MKNEEMKKKIESKLYFNGFPDAKVTINESKKTKVSKLRSFFSNKPQVTVQYTPLKQTVLTKLYKLITGKNYIKKKKLM